MGKTIRQFKGSEYGDRFTPKRSKDKKKFVFAGEQWATVSGGGPGNKRGWKQPLPKFKFKEYKEKVL